MGKYTVMKSVYHGRVMVGGKVFSTVFDSGSGHLILPGIKCTDKACLKHRQYDSAASPTGQDIDYDGTPVKPGSERDQLTVNFGTGEVTGVFVKDEVCLPDPRTDFDAAAGVSNASTAGVCSAATWPARCPGFRLRTRKTDIGRLRWTRCTSAGSRWRCARTVAMASRIRVLLCWPRPRRLSSNCASISRTWNCATGSARSPKIA